MAMPKFIYKGGDDLKSFLDKNPDVLEDNEHQEIHIVLRLVGTQWYTATQKADNTFLAQWDILNARLLTASRNYITGTGTRGIGTGKVDFIQRIQRNRDAANMCWVITQEKQTEFNNNVRNYMEIEVKTALEVAFPDYPLYREWIALKSSPHHTEAGLQTLHALEPHFRQVSKEVCQLRCNYEECDWRGKRTDEDIELLKMEAKDSKQRINNLERVVGDLSKEKFQLRFRSVCIELQKTMVKEIDPGAANLAGILKKKNAKRDAKKEDKLTRSGLKKFNEYKRDLGSISHVKDIVVNAIPIRNAYAHAGQQQTHPGKPEFPKINWNEMVRLMDDARIKTLERKIVETAKKRCPEIFDDEEEDEVVESGEDSDFAVESEEDDT
jgi:hypothetical protein